MKSNTADAESTDALSDSKVQSDLADAISAIGRSPYDLPEFTPAPLFVLNDTETVQEEDGVSAFSGEVRSEDTSDTSSEEVRSEDASGTSSEEARSEDTSGTSSGESLSEDASGTSSEEAQGEDTSGTPSEEARGEDASGTSSETSPDDHSAAAPSEPARDEDNSAGETQSAEVVSRVQKETEAEVSRAVKDIVESSPRPLLSADELRGRIVRVTALAAVCLIFVFGIVTLIKPDRTFSANENRRLEGRPAFSLSALTDGSFFSGLTKRFSEQFLLRDSWISLRFYEDFLLGKRESHGVYIGKDNYLFGAPEEPDRDDLQKITDELLSFAEKYDSMTTRMMVVPSASTVIPEKLPANAPVRSQAADITAVGNALDGSGIIFINPTQHLRNNSSSQLYYRTDHHWTSFGARVVFDTCSPQLGISEPIGDYDGYLLSADFLGTLGSQSGSYGTRDLIRIYVPRTDVIYSVSIPDEGITTASLYFSEKLDEKDQYQVFLGGNHSLVEIRTTADTGRNLLLIKDSYANSFVQYLIPYFDKIIMVDPRYYYDSLSQTISQNSINEVLLLYSANTLFTDTSLADCLAS